MNLNSHRKVAKAYAFPTRDLFRQFSKVKRLDPLGHCRSIEKCARRNKWDHPLIPKVLLGCHKPAGNDLANCISPGGNGPIFLSPLQGRTGDDLPRLKKLLLDVRKNQDIFCIKQHFSLDLAWLSRLPRWLDEIFGRPQQLKRRGDALSFDRAGGCFA